MNIPTHVPSFSHDYRQPLQDYTSNLDNIRQARSKINELQNIINELNRSQNTLKHQKPSSISPIRKSPQSRNVTPPVQVETFTKYLKNCETSKKPSPRFQSPITHSDKKPKQQENIIDIQILQGILPDSLILNIDLYVQLKVLGLGSYAIVRQATKGSQMVAIKTYEKSKLNDHQKRKNVTREVKILSKLRHPNIIRLIGASETFNQLHVVMEYVSSTSLNTYIKNKSARKLSEEEAKPIFKQIIDALRYCHHKNVVHRDIKLENLLIDENQQIKLIDFGFSIAIDPSTKLNVFCGTPSYMAPEIVNKQQYGFPADVWALGILLFKITTGLFPFRGTDDKDLFKKINSGKLEFPPGQSANLIKFITKMLRVQQYDRPSLKELMQDEWLI